MSLSHVPDGREMLAQRGLLRRSALISMGCDLPGRPLVADWFADSDHVARLTQALTDAVTAYLAANPLEQGMTLDSVRHALGLPDRRLVEALVEPPLRVSDGRVTDSRADQVLPKEVADAVASVCRELADHPFRAPEMERPAALGLGRHGLAAAERAGRLLRVADDVVLLPEADLAAATVLSRLSQPFTVSAAREALDSTRRVVVPLLEYLDRRGLTERLDDVRRRCVAAPGAQG